MTTAGSMGQWKARVLKKKGRGSQATGRSKGIVASPIQKYMCRRNRSYKLANYGAVMASIGQRAKK